MFYRPLQLVTEILHSTGTFCVYVLAVEKVNLTLWIPCRQLPFQEYQLLLLLSCTGYTCHGE